MTNSLKHQGVGRGSAAASQGEWHTVLLPACVGCIQVSMLEGDLNSDNLGLSDEHLSTALAEVEVVIHSAASIELEADVQNTLSSNYLGTRRLLMLASRMQRLRCFLHVSTAYVNVNLPRGSSVEERIYPLKLGEQLINHAEIVEDLLSLEPEDANCRVRRTAMHMGGSAGSADRMSKRAGSPCWSI